MAEQQEKELPIKLAGGPLPEKTPCGMLKLSFEIREMIYKYLVIDELYEGTPEASFMGLFWSCRQICSEFRSVTSRAQPLLFASSSWNHVWNYKYLPLGPDKVEKAILRFRITERFFSVSRSKLLILFPATDIDEFSSRISESHPDRKGINLTYHPNPYVRALSHVLQLPWTSITFKMPRDMMRDSTTINAYATPGSFYYHLFDVIRHRNIYKRQYFHRTSRLIFGYFTEEEELPVSEPATPHSMTLGWNKINKYRSIGATFNSYLHTWSRYNLPCLHRGWLCFRPVSRTPCLKSKRHTYELEFKTVYDFDSDLLPPDGALWENLP